MNISYDKKNLISCGRDGTICIFSIIENDNNGIIDLEENAYSQIKDVLVLSS